jgi:phosphopantothenoylcysteine decarboxylase/phosphopantothenate--cysteine ligase
MELLKGKKILVGITGGIAAYKSADLVRRLKEFGAVVHVVMTETATKFITPLTLQAVSGNPVHLDLFDPDSEAAMGHIELARWADFIVVAPATADFIAKLAHGFAGDLLTTLCLAATTPIILAPAMNHQMWKNSITQENIGRLVSRGIFIFGPAEGSQACGETGPGRMLEPLDLIHYFSFLLQPKALAGKKVLITAGPTQEDIDPVRFIGNRSSGKMAYAVAEAAVHAGAKVTLISGPVDLLTPPQVKRIDVQTAQEMYEAALKEVKTCDIFIAAAAVADYRCDKIAKQKIAKTKSTLTLQLVKNPDILASVANLSRPPFTVGFAAETENLEKNAQAKLKNKKINMIVANRVGIKNEGFVSDTNRLTVFWPKEKKEFPLASKKKLAHELIELIVKLYFGNNKD